MSGLQGENACLTNVSSPGILNRPAIVLIRQ
jgi:hypothetical protein